MFVFHCLLLLLCVPRIFSQYQFVANTKCKGADDSQFDFWYKESDFTPTTCEKWCTDAGNDCVAWGMGNHNALVTACSIYMKDGVDPTSSSPVTDILFLSGTGTAVEPDKPVVVVSQGSGTISISSTWTQNDAMWTDRVYTFESMGRFTPSNFDYLITSTVTFRNQGYQLRFPSAAKIVVFHELNNVGWEGNSGWSPCDSETMVDSPGLFGMPSTNCYMKTAFADDVVHFHDNNGPDYGSNSNDLTTQKTIGFVKLLPAAASATGTAAGTPAQAVVSNPSDKNWKCFKKIPQTTPPPTSTACASPPSSCANTNGTLSNSVECSCGVQTCASGSFCKIIAMNDGPASLPPVFPQGTVVAQSTWSYDENFWIDRDYKMTNFDVFTTANGWSYRMKASLGKGFTIQPSSDSMIAVLTLATDGTISPPLSGTWTACTSNVAYIIRGTIYYLNACQERSVKKNTVVKLDVIGVHHMVFVKHLCQSHVANTAACTTTDGSSPNQNACTCGTSNCDAAGTGLYCWSALNKCSKSPACSSTDASQVNTESCTCGLSDCDTTSGLFCLAVANKCANTTMCSTTDGTAANAAACLCGTNQCDATSGLYCRLDSHRCGNERLYPPLSDATFFVAAQNYDADGTRRTTATDAWGPISEWDTSAVTDMSQGFALKNFYSSASTFTGDLSKWDVSNVVIMFMLFYNCGQFNSDLSNWDVSKVRNLGSTFYQAVAFQSNLSEWDTSSMVEMYNTFYAAARWNSDISKWDVSKVISIGSMLKGASAFVQETWCSESWNTVGSIGLSDIQGQLKYSDSSFGSVDVESGTTTLAASQGEIFCCNPGSFATSIPDKSCRLCGAGQMTNLFNIDSSCSVCERDFIAPNIGLTACGACASDKYSSVERTECKICGAGMATVRGTSETSCSMCLGGKYQSLAGENSCVDCPHGWFQEDEGKPFW